MEATRRWTMGDTTISEGRRSRTRSARAAVMIGTALQAAPLKAARQAGLAAQLLCC